MGDLQMLPLHTKVTWSGRDDMVPIEHRGSGPEARSAVSPRHGVAERVAEAFAWPVLGLAVWPVGLSVAGGTV
jgi:hypothetical protein